MYPGYVNLGCSEVVNNERAAAYAAAAGYGGDPGGPCTASATLPIDCDRCEDLPFALGHDPYTTPQNDDAPWWDPARPVSGDFLGMMGGIITGLSMSTATRTPVAYVGDGSSIGPLRRAHREVQFTVTAIARGECALSYGMEWLARSLSGDPCAGSCIGQELIMYACCPSEIPNEDFDAEIRRMYDVGLLEGPSVTERTYYDNGDIVWATVTFTLVIGNPWIYGDPLDTGDEWVSLADGVPVRTDPDQVFQRCLPPAECAADPLCPPPILPPQVPVPVSPCYPRGVGEFLVSRIRVAAEEYPLWAELVPVVEVNAGAGELRRILVRFWSNPTNGDCAEELDPCDSCGDINITYVPVGGRLSVDGRTARSVIECEDRFLNISRSVPNLFGPEGGLFSYPYFPCAGGMCVEVWVSTESVAADAQARVILVPRSDVM